MDISRDFAKLTEKLKNSREVEVPIKTLNSPEETFVYGLITRALSYIDQIQLETTVHMAAAEIIRNAEKAVLKKLYLKSENLDASQITPKHARDFYAEYRDQIANLRTLTRNVKHIAIFKARITDVGLEINIVNAGAPLPDETKMIQDRLDIGFRVSELNEIMVMNLDTGEGEGRGIALAALSLKKAGLPAKSCVFHADEKKTLLRITVPRGVRRPEDMERIEKELLSEVESLPSFPDHIQKIMDLCESETSSTRQISDEIARDPSIAGQIIRLANSGGFAGGNISELEEAVKIVGLSNISGLLLKVGAFHILEEKYGKSEELTEHPVRVAYYARSLSRKFKLGALGDHAYVAGLLHDIGKVVLLSVLPDRKAFESLGENRDRRSQVNLEELQCGVSHAVVGELLAVKWKFPDYLKYGISLHHRPAEASEEERKLVYVVYLANAIADFQNEKTYYFALEPDVLSFFNLTTEEAFEMLSSNLSNTYQLASE